MATIRKRGKRWQAQVRRKGARPVSRSFVLKDDAEAWARATEAAIDRGEVQAGEETPAITLREMLERYRETVSSKKRSFRNERIIIDALLKRDFVDTLAAEAGADIFAAYRDARLATVKPVTINRELGLLQHAYDIARTEWNLSLPTNPLKLVRRPRVGPHRDRRLRPGEEERLFASAAECRNPHAEPLIRLAIATAMRKGELLRIREDDMDRDARLLRIPKTKNGHPRTIPLSRLALNELEGQTPNKEGRLFATTENAVRLSWQRLTRRAGLDDLHFHDLRHEAISRFFELGLSVPEVALISGHKDPRQLFRYTHLRAEDLLVKLD